MIVLGQGRTPREGADMIDACGVVSRGYTVVVCFQPRLVQTCKLSLCAQIAQQVPTQLPTRLGIRKRVQQPCVDPAAAPASQ